jgi:dipeptidase E
MSTRKPLPTIVAVGGGEIAEGETLAIDREIIRLSGRTSPRALFVPTASSDAVGYWDTFRGYFGDQLGCTTDVLWLIRERPSRREIEKKILSADFVYVGGGNSLRMLRRWRFLGVDAVFGRAYRQGVVLSGISAGALCWFNYGTSDSMSFYDSSDVKLIRVRALGLISAVASPHHINEPARTPALVDIMRRTPGVGLAIDDYAALVIRGDRYRIVSSRPGATVRRVIHGSDIYQPLAESGRLDRIIG